MVLTLPSPFKALFAGLSVVLVGGVLLMTATVGDVDASQKEFGKSRRYDATQCVAVEEEQMIVKKNKKKKFLAVFAENKCSRPIQALACFQVISPTMKHPRNGWYCSFHEYKSRSRTMISDHAKYGRVKKWAGCNNTNEDCIRIIKNTEAAVNSSGRDPEIIAKRMR
jgi:hypothetical protein